MPAALIFLLSLLAATPVVLFVDGPLTLGAWSAAVAGGLFIAALVLRPGEAAHLKGILRPLAFGALIPVLVMLAQAAPLPFFGRLANPIWESAGAALGRPLTPSLSIDSGATLLALCRYLAWLGIGLLASMVTLDRQRAERVMFAATAAATAWAVVLIINDMLDISWLGPVRAIGRGGALDGAVLGLILSAACADRAYQRYETRKATDARAASRLAKNFGLCAACFMLCAAAVGLADPRNTLFAAAAGLATLLGVLAVRRVGYALGGALTVAAFGCLVIVAFFAEGTRQRDVDLTVKYAAPSSPSKAITGRMLAGNAFTGSGAGTYHDLVPIYRGLDDLTGNIEPATAAAAIALEFGRTALWIAIIAVLAMTASLLRAALRRGRDSFYATCGASTLVALLILSFGNPGLFGSAVLILSGAVLGLAFAQSRSRPAR